MPDAASLMLATGFTRIMNERAETVAWRAAARSPHEDMAAIAAAVAQMERTWLAHLAAGGNPALETARAMFPGPWFEQWRMCR